MDTYRNSQQSGRISAAQFARDGAGTLAFLTLRDASAAAEIRAQLVAPPLALTVLAEHAHDEQVMLLARSTMAEASLVAALAKAGEPLAVPPPEKKPFNPWAWRGYTSLAGQGLQIISSQKTIRAPGESASDSKAIFGFAALNIIANAINIIFGGQEKNDPNHLRVLKKELNAKLAPHVGADTLPSPEDDRLSQRPKQRKSAGEHFSALLGKYSVSFGEIILRTVGSASLAFPFTQWKDVGKVWRETKSVGQAFEAAKCHNPKTYKVGLMMLTGKFVSFLSSEPDPYNPNPPGLLRQFREKVTFRLSSVIEGVAAGIMGYDRLKNKKVMLGGKERPDIYGGAGNAIFIGGYGVRLAAPYGSRVVNMPELIAHASDSLALLPREQLPERMLETAQYLAQHFKDTPADKKNPMDVASLYTRIAEDLAKQHGIRAVSPAAQHAYTETHTQSETPKPHITEAAAHSLMQSPELAAAPAR